MSEKSGKEDNQEKKALIGFAEEDKNRIISVVVTITVTLVILALLVMTLWTMLDLVLLTFILTFLFYHFQKMIKNRLGEKIRDKIPDGLILFILYLIVIGLLTWISVVFVPKLILQINEIATVFMHFDMNTMRDALDPRLAEILWDIDLNPYISDAGNFLMNSVTLIGAFSLNFVFAFLLSFMILLEKDKIRRFSETLKHSKIAFVYEHTMKFGGSFVRTFGTVMKVQVTISFVNSILSVIILGIMGFPSVIGLGIMIFFLGLIPVAGVIISLVPLCIIGFTIGGFKMVIAVIIMIIVIHSLEAYILNPKLMSTRTSLPICFVFIILLVSEHYLGAWGLLIGVPLFIFLMKSFEVDYQEACKPKPVFNPERFKNFRKRTR